MNDQSSVQVCVPVCERSLGAMKEAAASAGQMGEIVELRLDCLDDAELRNAVEQLNSWLPTLNRPVIMTLRPLKQGGPRPLDQKIRLELVEKGIAADLLDIELDLATVLLSDSNHNVDWDRIICSHHDFVGVPSDLEQIYQRLLATPARVVKIAVQANDATDCLPVLNLLDRARSQGRAMIAIAMGFAGIPSRIIGPCRGAFLTYASLNSNRATGPGQLTVDEMNDLFHVRNITRATAITGLAGMPVSHSISPSIHNAAFASAGIDAVYIPFEVQNMRSFITRMVHPRTRELDWNMRGLSVTAPHKAAVMDQLDWIDPAASQIGAVNTVVVNEDQLHGYNTDGAALIQPLVQRLGRLDGTCCAVLGAGGAARAALWSLQKAGAAVTVFARDLKKREAASAGFGADCRSLDGSAFQEFDVVINATPLGTRGSLSEQTPAVAQQLRGIRLAYDLVYNPSETRFLREAHEAGCETLGGLEMLVAQALTQFRLWTGIEAPEEVMRLAAINALN